MGIADGSLLGQKVAVVTVKNYVKAASEFATDDNFPDPRFRYDKMGNKIGGQFDYFPALKDLYNILSKWKVAKAEGLPLTIDMLKALAKSAAASDPNSEEACITDATILGLYTGSRCSEYCKGNSKPFSKVPTNPQTEDTFAGWPIAFTPTDFLFLSSDLNTRHWSQIDPNNSMVRIRFRYDKGGGRNFSERMFASINCEDEAFQQFCPVKTCLRILRRWQAINKDSLTPVFCYLNKQKRLTYLTDTKVTARYRELVKEIYPTTHLFYKRIKDFRTHSVRITACLLLSAEGYEEHIIEFKLRWASSAWKTYLREHLGSVKTQSDAVFRNAVSQGSFHPKAEMPSHSSPLQMFDTNTDDGK